MRALEFYSYVKIQSNVIDVKINLNFRQFIHINWSGQLAFVPRHVKGGRRSPAVACWASDHWVAGSNQLRGKFRH